MIAILSPIREHRFFKITLISIIGFIPMTTAIAQSTAVKMPVIIEKDGRHQLLVDGKAYFILGGQAHNSSAWPGMLPQLWRSAEALHVNTLEVPLYWEQIEPQPGKFDFSVLDMLVTQARQHQIRLVFLWFGTWKNGSNHYMPEWMKLHPEKYPNITGKKGQPVDSPSPVIKATMDADITAFSAIMKHLKVADAVHTVIMVQVENESGSWDTIRDYAPIAQKLFEEPVPPALLKPEVLKALNVSEVSKGNWEQVFGDRASEYFQAWSIASFVGKVAAAGKAEYALPLYVNAALRDPLTNPKANEYESGGPTDNVIPIWKAAAPAIDVLAPDIYLPGSERVLKVLDLYDRPNNALFVPEIGLLPVNANYLFGVIAHGGIGFSPFGIDANKQFELAAETTERLAPFAQQYITLAPMMAELNRWAFDGKVKAVAEHEDHAEQTIELNGWQAVVSFGKESKKSTDADKEPAGKLMIIQLATDKFIIVGSRCHITFIPSGKNKGRAWQYLKVEEGYYENGTFKPLRILNGDETDFGGPRFDSAITVLQTTLTVG